MVTALAPRTVVATATASAALGKNTHTPVDATSGARTMTLPPGAPQGTLVSVERVDASANVITISGNIRGVPNATLAVLWQGETLELIADASGSWRPVAGHKPKGALDAMYAAKAGDAVKGIVLVETAIGVWSGDAPVRSGGVNPILFVSRSDPADPTNGIASPGNIAEFDSWDPIL